MHANNTVQPTATPANPMLLLVDGSSYLYRAFHAGGDWRVTLPDGSRQGISSHLGGLRVRRQG